MEGFYVISDELLDKAMVELFHGKTWMAYNEIDYFLDSTNVLFFKTDDEANGFTANNISDRDCYRYTQVTSIEQLLQTFPYQANLENTSTLKPSKTIANSISPQLNLDFMNTENVDALKKNLLNMGFGDTLNEALVKHINDGSKEFQLKHEKDYNMDKMESTLNFKYSETTERYYFNSYDAVLEKGGSDISRSQRFYAEYGNSTTLKEAYNLLDGRSVHKDLVNKEEQPYAAWVKLDFEGERTESGNYKVQRYTQNYGFDLKDALAALPIKELADSQKAERLVQSLEKGNLQSVTMTIEGNVTKMYIEASPQFKNVNVYDNDLKPVKRESLLQEGNAQKEGKVEAKEVKQGGGLAKVKTNKKDNCLLQKKREGSHRGQHV